MSYLNICAQWPAIRAGRSQSDALATVLSRAFYDGPEFRYIMPDDEDRLVLLPAVFRASIRASQLYGEIHTTPGGDGAALCIAPRQTVTRARMVRTARGGIWKSASMTFING